MTVLETLAASLLGRREARVSVIQIIVARPCHGKRDGRDSAFGRPGHDESNMLGGVVRQR
jgi:hypothetical protein